MTGVNLPILPVCPHCDAYVSYRYEGAAVVPDPTCAQHAGQPAAAPAGALGPTVLEEAAGLVDGPRRHTYGHPRDNHERTAALWSAYLGVPISARQVCMLNALQKVGRDAHRPWRDNLVDLAGWARNAELCSEDEGQGGGAWAGAT